MDRADALRRLGERASDQWGLVTAAQAKLDGAQGVDLLRLERAGLLENVGRGVYRIAAAVPPEHLESKVAWLRLDPKTPAWQRVPGERRSGVVSHASACELHGLGDLPVDRVEMIVPVRRTTRDDCVLLHQLALEAEDITVVDGLPVTTVERTIADLLRSRADGAHIGTVIADADLKGLLDVERLAARVGSFARAYGLPATASGEDLLGALCEQAGRTLRSREGEQAAAAGFASAVTAMETLASHPGALDRLMKSLGRQQTALQSLGGAEQMTKTIAAAQQSMAQALGQTSALELLMKDAAARDERLRSALARPSALEQMTKTIAAAQQSLRDSLGVDSLARTLAKTASVDTLGSLAARSNPMQQALAGYDRTLKALGKLPAALPPDRPRQAETEENG
ncbi:type IV toxin-antitoxin system AbiEi family antitoxin domain-containing protein [Streptomyces mirabilis]|uniref:type IV toxin-antitoxin system AbiEi family antitoxin domain-containing protein n=1 Tax=Streptomyces mirabilis TaxID=68239 RepID=UPI0036A031EA